MKYWKQFKSLPNKIRKLVYFSCSVSVYAFFGFVLLPLILQPIIIDKLSATLNRDVKIKTLETNPFSLSITVNDFKVLGKHTDELLGFEKLYVNYQFMSLFKQSIAFDEISLLRPSVKIMLLPSGEYNFQDIILALKNNADAPLNTESKGKPEEQADELAKENSWPLVIDKFRYVNGSVYFSDENRVTPFRTQVENISVSLDDFTTKPGDGNVYHVKASTLQGAAVDWKGEFSLFPLKSKGQVKLNSNLMLVSDYLYEQMLLKINSGNLDLSLHYQFNYSEAGLDVLLTGLQAMVTKMDIQRKDNGKKILAWDELSLDLETFDLKNKKVSVNAFSTQGIYAALDVSERAELDFSDLFVLQNALSEKTDKTGVSSASANDNWDVLIKRINNENILIDVIDASVLPVAEHNVKVSQFEIVQLRPFTDEQALLKLSLNLNDGGVIDLQGSVKPKSKTMDVKLHSNNVALNRFQSYINSLARVELLNGFFGTDINIVVDGSSNEPKVLLKGDVHLYDLKMSDKKLKETFLSWKKLNIKNIEFNYPETSVGVGEINFDKPYLRLVMNGGGETNIQKLIIEKIEKANKKEETDKQKSKFQMVVDRINIKDGKMDFSDDSLSPKFSAGIYSLKGNISGLSSKEKSKAKVDLKGKIDKYAPVIIKGDINPLTEEKFTEIEMLFKGVELTTFTPYSGKFAGYKIEKGKLSLDLNYKLSKNELIAENRVILDQLTLGEETGSEEATSLPVNFALSLLKDANGVIDFNLPIRGNIDEPDFQYGSLVWGALGNMILGIISSPFNALANLVGGDSEGLDYIVFQANKSQLLESEKIKLDALSKALLQRPNLYLEVGGVSSALIDHDEMAYVKVLKKLKLKIVPLTASLDEDAKDEIVDYYEIITKKSAADLLPKKHQLTSKQQQEIIFDKALLAVLNATQITESEYRELAQHRALLIQGYLIEVGKVSAENVFLLDSKTSLSNELEDVELAQLKLPLNLKAK